MTQMNPMVIAQFTFLLSGKLNGYPLCHISFIVDITRLWECYRWIKVKLCNALNWLIAFRWLVTSNETVVKGQSGTLLFSLIDFGSLFVLLWHGQSPLWVLLLRITSPFEVFFWIAKTCFSSIPITCCSYLNQNSLRLEQWLCSLSYIFLKLDPQSLLLHDCNNQGRDPGGAPQYH